MFLQACWSMKLLFWEGLVGGWWGGWVAGNRNKAISSSKLRLKLELKVTELLMFRLGLGITSPCSEKDIQYKCGVFLPCLFIKT